VQYTLVYKNALKKQAAESRMPKNLKGVVDRIILGF
jgi:hypothetical protein